MAQLIVRNLDQDVKERIAQRARLHGRSMEEEIRSILRDAVREIPDAMQQQDFGTMFASYFEGLDMPEIKEIRGFKIQEIDFSKDES